MSKCPPYKTKYKTVVLRLVFYANSESNLRILIRIPLLTLKTSFEKPKPNPYKT